VQLGQLFMGCPFLIFWVLYNRYKMCEAYQNINFLNYSYGTPIAVVLLLGLFVLFSGFKNISNRIYFLSIIGFLIWMVCDYLSFALTNPSHILLSEKLATLGILGPMFASMFIYIFPENRQLSRKVVLALILPIIPLIILLPTKFIISSITPAPECNVTTGTFYLYLAFLILYYITSIFIISIKKIRTLKGNFKKQLILFISGTTIFLFLVILLAVIPSIYEQYNLVILAPFSVVIFAGFCAYAIVRYQVFNLKIIAAQMLVISLIILIGSLLFYVREAGGRVLIAVNLLLSLFFGWLLVRSVKMEIKQKEELKKLSDDLAVANEKLRKIDASKTDFINIASHQLKKAPTPIKGNVSLLLEGSYGEVPENQKKILQEVYTANERQIDLVDDLLNVARMESGRVQLDFQKQRIEDICQEVYTNLLPAAKEKGLELGYEKPKKPLPILSLDKGKIFEAIFNFVENAIKL